MKLKPQGRGFSNKLTPSLMLKPLLCEWLSAMRWKRRDGLEVMGRSDGPTVSPADG